MNSTTLIQFKHSNSRQNHLDLKKKERHSGNMFRPRCILISGIDGSGKTTLAKQIAMDLESRGYKPNIVWIKAEHTFAFLVSRVLTALNWRRPIANPNGIIVTRLEFFDNRFTRRIWPLIEFSSVLPLVIFKVKLPLLLGHSLVLDRFTVDTIVSVSLKVKKSHFEKSYFAELLLSMIPKNCVFFLLDVDLTTVLERRPDIELSLEEVERELKLYKILSRKMNAIPLKTGVLTIEESKKKIIDVLFPRLIPEVSLKQGTKLDFSVVIPTCNRAMRLKRLLSSILGQEILPSAIVIVDQSDDSSTLELADIMKQEFSKKKISFQYQHTNEKNSSRARNLGVEYSTTEVVFFIDDDVGISNGYTKEILQIYKDFPDAIGVQGILTSHGETSLLKSPSSRLENHLRRAFFLSHYRGNKWLVMPSINDIRPFPPTRIIRMQRMQGCCSYKRKVLDTFRFDEKLEGWSFLEDLDLSYRIYKANMGSLYLTPRARIIHDEHMHMSGSVKVETYKKIVNRTYIFFKLIKQTPCNCAIFCWSILGFLLTTTLGTILGRKKEKNRWIPIYLIEAAFYSLRHLKEIRQLNLSFLSNVQ